MHVRMQMIDGHNDLPWEYRAKVRNNVTAIDISVLQPSLQTDIPRLREGKMGGQFWSVYVPCEFQVSGVGAPQPRRRCCCCCC